MSERIRIEWTPENAKALADELRALRAERNQLREELTRLRTYVLPHIEPKLNRTHQIQTRRAGLDEPETHPTAGGVLSSCPGGIDCPECSDRRLS